MAGGLVLVGCSKPAQTGQQMDINGVKVDLPKLQQTFVAERPDLQPNVSRTTMAIRYGQYDQALAELEKLAAAANLTDPQKKLISDLTEQVKQVMAKAPPKPAA